jgi:hypothetical protein
VYHTRGSLLERLKKQLSRDFQTLSEHMPQILLNSSFHGTSSQGLGDSRLPAALDLFPVTITAISR